ncbi:MAG: hypothetical protein JRI23_11815 [Deltaproteobacteria bacterium]|jgi:hypothetical protein|nr:hypothetical protein [Deltaproteobacteria bacterium]MBW2532394.1 hypothetical protein [Deltaproteobacteria bacterium]
MQGQTGVVIGTVVLAWVSALAGCDADESGGSGGGTTVTDGGSGGTGGSGTGTASGGSGTGTGTGTGTGGIGGGAVGCDPLPAPTGTVINVDTSQANDLPSIVDGASTGDTIVLAAGTYTMSVSGESSRRIQFHTPGIAFRGATDDAADVVIDAEYQTNEMITIHASDVTIANLTLTRAVDHPIHVTGGDTADITGTKLYNLRIIDGGEQFVKVNASQSNTLFADDGELACSYFELTDQGRPNIEPNPGGCYTGGIDAHYAWGWVVRDNVFVDIYCDNGGLAEHAVHFWSASRDTVVERNLIVNCARGVGFGLVENGNVRNYPDDPYSGIGYIGHYDGIIRNNVIYADHQYFDTGIELDQARGAVVLHNTIVQPGTAYSSIDYRFPNTLVTVRNNIVRNITQRNSAQGTVDTNLETTDTSIFVDVAGQDFHLASGSNAAVDAAAVEAEAGTDIDGETHDNGAPDMGADERW